MALSAGTKLGPYEIVAPLGAGGLGEVYRARDSRLNREVAIKVLPEAFARDAERLSRFQREAKMLASLNHPNIASIYGLEDQGNVHALVMELVEGPTLADRIRQAAIPAEEALPIAKQIAEGVEYAHERGIIHRDLKPANIKLAADDAVKILDFGLAKALDADSSQRDMSSSPTITHMATQAGIILGTAAYMSPEQAKGKMVDRRTDIWAFGCVLYEMLAGKAAFAGESITETLSAVIREEPNWSLLPADTPPAIARLLARCMKKDAKQRLQSMGDARIAIEEVLSGAQDISQSPTASAPVVAHRRSRERIAWALAAIAGATLLIAAALAFVFARSYLNQPKPGIARFLVSLPENVFIYQVSPSPDGRFLAFVGVTKEGVRQLWLRPIDAVAAQPMAGTDGAGIFFWSPDSRYLAYDDDTGLNKVAVSGGAPQRLCALARIGTGSWSTDGVILFGTFAAGPLMKVSAEGGEPSPVTTLDRSLAETRHVAPSFLPDGRHFLYLSLRNTTGPQAWICVGSLDSNQTKCLENSNSAARYAPPGYLLYERGNTLVAQGFDLRGLVTTGDPVPIADSVGSFSVSDSGVLSYTAAATADEYLLQWFDRSGKILGTVGQPGLYSAPAISPDGNRLAVGVLDPHVNTRDLWLFDLKRNTSSRLTFDPTDESNPAWSHDGSQIVFTSTQTGNRDIYEKAASGLGNSQVVFASKDQQRSVDDWSPDDRYVVYDTTSPGSLWVLPLFGDRKPFLFVQGATEAREARFSPNGRYIAYSSNESGSYEVYVQSFPDHGGKWQVSSGGGQHPEWRHDGKELYFISSGKLVAVDVSTDGAQFQSGVPKPLFAVDFRPDRGSGNGVYVVSADGQRFLAVTNVEQQTVEPATVVMNWASDLKP
jgi:Tol biopolymer transport system component